MKAISKNDRGNKKYILAKVNPEYYKWLRDIAKLRFMNGLDKTYSPQTVEKKMLKHPELKKIENDLKIAKFLKDDTDQYGGDGQFSTIFILFRFMIVAFITVVLFGGLIWIMGMLNDSFIEIGVQNEGNAGNPGYTNLSHASEVTFGQVNNSIQALRLVALTLIFSEILLIFVLNSFRRVHPAMFMVWALIVFLAVMFAAPIANAYESLLQSGVYDGILASFTGGNYILLNLPTVVLVIGILGGIFMFINIIRTEREQNL